MENKISNFKEGDIAYFYYSPYLKCVKCKIISITIGINHSVFYRVTWNDEIDKKLIHINYIHSEKVFQTKDQCLLYAEKKNGIYKEKLRMELNTQQDLLQYMYDCIYSDDYDYSHEKEVIREKCKELFGIELRS